MDNVHRLLGKYHPVAEVGRAMRPERNEPLLYASGPFRKSPGQLFFGERRRGPSFYAVEPEPGLDLLRCWQRRVVSAGENLTACPAPSESGRELTDIDVHAPSICPARLCQGRGVHRKDRKVWHLREAS